jgi:putative N6-adenine-specific DNA methylase
MSGPEYDLFAVTAHGLADLCAAELATIAVSGTPETGGVAWRGTAESMYRANLELRTASRIIARAGEFRARGFAELERRAAKLTWHDFLRPGTAVELRVTCRKSKLYHEGAVAERLARVLADTAGAPVLDTNAGAEEVEAGDASAAGQLIIVRLMRDVCTISVDSSGALLHQRGYRRALAKAPLRETIAAALLLASGWRGDTPLIDPLCGSGTIPIEAALLARGIAPGIASADLTPRAFAFERWPHFDGPTFDELVHAARAGVRAAYVPIIAADRDGGAIAAAQANAQRAGVAYDIEFRRARLQDLEPIPGTGHVITNPPYGVRVGDRRALRTLYATLGGTIAATLPGWNVTLLAADDALAAATGLPLVERLATRNGGIPVRLLTTVAGAAAHTPARPVYQRPYNDEERA